MRGLGYTKWYLRIGKWNFWIMAFALWLQWPKSVLNWQRVWLLTIKNIFWFASKTLPKIGEKIRWHGRITSYCRLSRCVSKRKISEISFYLFRISKRALWVDRSFLRVFGEPVDPHSAYSFIKSIKFQFSVYSVWLNGKWTEWISDDFTLRRQSRHRESKETTTSFHSPNVLLVFSHLWIISVFVYGLQLI